MKPLMTAELFLFGVPRLRRGETLQYINSQKGIALITYLALKQESAHRDALANLLWENKTQSQSRANLRQMLRKLKTIFTENELLVTHETVSFNFAGDFRVDVHHFLEIAGTVETQSIEKLEESTRIYHDDLLAGAVLPDSPMFIMWYNRQNTNLQQHLQEIYTRIINFHQQNGQLDKAIKWARALVKRNPLNESNHILLMNLYLQGDEPISAINQYHAYCSIIYDDISASPGVSIQKLYESITGTLTEHRSTSITPKKTFIGRLPLKPHLVLGRNDTIQHIQELFTMHQRQRVIVQGWPGIGKTTLLSQLAYDTEIKRYFTSGILWTALGRNPNIQYELNQLINAIRPDDSMIDLPLSSASERLRQLVYGQRIFIIIDDVWDSHHLHWFPTANEHGGTIISTRFNDIARQVAASGEEIYKLPILSYDAAYHLLKHLAPAIVTAYPQQIKRLIIDLEGLPLALQVAGRLLYAEAEMGWGIDDLLEALDSGQALLEAEAPLDRLLEDDTLPTVSMLLQQSTNRLTPEMRLRFATLGVVAPRPATFDMAMIRAMWQTEKPQDGIRTLVDRGLLEPAGNGRFQMHSLLVKHAKTMLGGS